MEVLDLHEEDVQEGEEKEKQESTFAQRVAPVPTTVSALLQLFHLILAYRFPDNAEN